MWKRIVGWMLATCVVALGYQGGSNDATSVEGRVVAQTNGAPLRNALVRLRQIRTSPAQRMERQLLQQTNEEGRFLFANVPSGDWELSADKRGFLPGKYGARKYDAQASRIAVKPGQQVKDVVVRLVPQSVIAGRVLDNEGEPVEGARIALLKLGHADGAPRLSEAASAVTLDNGEYRIPRVAAGRYLVRCTVAGTDSSRVETAFAATYHPNVTDPSQAAAVEVRDAGAETSGIEIRVARTRVFHVRGRLQPSDARRDLARVALVDKADPAGTLAESRIAPPDYLFDFGGVPPGSYLLYGWSSRTVASTTVEVKEQDVENLFLNPVPGEVRGSLKLKPGGRQVDLRALSVTIQPLELGRRLVHLPGPVKISDDLTYRYAASADNLATFTVQLSRVPDGCYLESIQYGNRRVPDSGIEYSHGAALEITIGCDGATVEGSTVDEDGDPFAGAVVALFPADGKSPPPSSISGPRGAFRLAGVPPGDYKLLAFDDIGRDDLDNPDLIRRSESQATSVRLDRGGSASASIRVIKQEVAQ